MSSPDPGRPTLKLFGQGLDISLYLSLLTLPKSEGCSPLAALDNAVLLPGLINSGGDDPATRRTVKFDLDLGAYADVGDAKLRAATILANSYRSRTPGAANREGVPGQGNASRRVGGTPRKDAATWEADSRQYVHNLILHAESEDIAVTWDSLPKHKGGFVMRRHAGSQVVRRDPKSAPQHVDAAELPRVSKADVMLMLNYRQTFASTFDVMVHELAHVLLGHLGAMRGASEGRLALNPNRPASSDVHEFEAYSVGHIVATVMGGFSAMVFLSLLPYHKKLTDQERLAEVDVLEVFIAAEVLCAWCAAPPGRDAVPGGSRRGPPSRPLVGQR